MRILIWLFFLLITGEAVWAKGPKVLFIGDSITELFGQKGLKFYSSVIPLLTVTGETVMELPNHLLSAIIGI